MAIVRHHAVHPEDHGLGGEHLQPLQKDPLRQAAKLEDVAEGEGVKLPLHFVRGRHRLSGHLDCPGEAAIHRQLVETD